MIKNEGRPNECLKTFVGGLPFYCDEQDLGMFMSQFGTVLDVYISREQTGYHKGFAFVNFSSVYSLEKLFGEHYFKSKVIEVKRNLHNQLLLSPIPEEATAADIQRAVEELRFPVAEVTIGGEHNGVPAGSASVRLVREDQMYQAVSIGKLMILDKQVEILSRAAKKPQNVGIKDNSNRKKQKPQTSTGRELDKRFARPQGLSLSGLSIENPEQQESFFNIVQSYTGLSINNDSEPSTVDLGFTPEPGSGLVVRRKLSSSLKTNSKEYFPSPHKADSIHLGRENSGALSLDHDFQQRITVAGRHNSECGIVTEPQTPLSKKLNGYSSSFYSMQNVLDPSQLNHKPGEVRVAFFTFPGKD